MKLSRAIHNMLSSGQINRRVANHMQLEDDADFQRKKARAARDAAIAKAKKAEREARQEAGQRVTGPTRVRRNRREY